MEVVKQIQQPNSLAVLKKILPNLSTQEQKIVEIKYQSTPVGKMDAIKLKAAAAALLAKIHVITGWNFPEEVEFQKILKEQFVKKLVENYETVNCDEIEYAFRNYPVKEWGKNMNINLISEVMDPYLNQRLEISKMEESSTRELPAPKEPEMPDDDFIELNRNIFLKSKLFGLVHPKCYDILVKQGKLKLSDEQKEDIRKKVRANFFSLENKDYQTVLSHEEIERYIKQDCKKWAVCEWFNLNPVT